MYKCKCVNLTNKYICKNITRRPYYLNNNPCCSFHFSYYTLKYVLLIQKIYRGYKQRKLVKNIYSKLPCDIQKKILNYVRRDFYYNKYVTRLGKIVENKFLTIKELIESNLKAIDTINVYTMTTIYNNLYTNGSKIYYTINLHKKYYELLKNYYKFDTTIITHLFYNLSSTLVKLKYSNYQDHYNLIYMIYCHIKNYIIVSIAILD